MEKEKNARQWAWSVTICRQENIILEELFCEYHILRGYVPNDVKRKQLWTFLAHTP